MQAAIVVQAGQAPVYGTFREPVASKGYSLVQVSASSISQLTKGRASGTHYSSDGTLPFIPGVDGTGVNQKGERVYFVMPEKPFGGMAELTLVDDRRCLILPEGVSDDEAAAMAIPGMSSWAALKERAHLVAGETVLINGATGTSGRLAIQIAKHLGAKKVIATGRKVAVFDELLELGADVTIALTEDGAALEHALSHEFEQGVDIVLDYLWGPSAEKLVMAGAKAGPEGVPIRYIQIGSIAGASINLPGAALRSSAIQMMGSGIGSVPMSKLLNAIAGVLGAAPGAGFKIDVAPVALADVNRVWVSGGSDSRIVLRP